MHFSLYKYLGKFDLLYERQFGCCQKYASVDALAEFTERLGLGIEKKISMKFSQ